MQATSETQVETKPRYSELSDDDVLWENHELYHGELIEIPMASAEHAHIEAKAAFIIQRWIYMEAGFGHTFVGEGGVKLAGDTRYSYDLGWSPESSIPQGIPTKPFKVMIEVFFSGDWDLLMQKADDYLKYGAQEVWLIFVNVRKFHVMRGDGTANWYKLGESYTPGDWMPGFTLKMDELFADLIEH